MTESRWARVAELFERAVALPEAERGRFLAAECGEDSGLLAEVRELLDADAAAPPVLDASPDTLALLASTATPVAEGWRVGPYRLCSELGRGGMGVVYLAERDDLKTTVALKLILLGPATVVHAVRFRREQLVHAQLEHPQIARLLDAGIADDGTPWLAMEYVEGTAIDRHADLRCLSLEERLALFEKVGTAVAYAHRNLVVHRDIKPSNIIVTPEGEPKLVDFGIAKPLAGHTTTPGAATHTGGALTLAYASPEQLRAEPVTTATDIYQLGLLLHELLTGLPATDREGRPLSPAARLAGLEPVRPSTLTRARPEPLPGQPSPPSPEARAARRRTTPERLRRALQGDLDTIIEKALRAEPAERYASAEQLVEDVRRHREGLPVLARPGSLAYRLGKAMRRHRVASLLLTLLLLALVGGTFAVGLQARRVVRERDRADQFSRLLEGIIYGMDPLGRGDSVTARTVLERTTREARAGLATEPEVWGRLLVVIGRTYQNLGHLDSAISLQRDALSALRHVEGSALLQSEARRSLGTALVRSGRFDEGVAQLEEAVALSMPLGPSGHRDLGMSLAELGGAHFMIGNLDSAVRLYQDGMDVLATLPDSGGSAFDRYRVDLGNVLLQAGQLAGPERLMLDAVDRLARREGPRSGATLHAKTELADVLLKQGRLREATQMATEVLTARRQLSQDPHEELANALLQHARSMAELGRLGEAETSMREALGMWRTLNGEHSPSVAYAEVWLADFLKRAGRVEEALELELIALEKYRRLSGERSAFSVWTATRVAHSEHLLGRLEASERRFREVLPFFESSPAASGRLVRPLTELGWLLADVGKCEEALPHLHRAIAIAGQGWGPRHPLALRPRCLHARCLIQLRRFEAAEAMLTAAWRDANAAGDYAAQMRAEVGATLVHLYEAWGQQERAEPYRAVAARAPVGQ